MCETRMQFWRRWKAMQRAFEVGSGYWMCSWCGQANPNYSNTCWKCGASK